MMVNESQRPAIKKKNCFSENGLAQNSNTGSNGSIDSFRSLAFYASSPEINSAATQCTVDELNTLEYAVPTASPRMSSIKHRKNVPIPCSCVERLRYCRCLGTGHVRPCSTCPQIDCENCAGAGVVPAFPAQPGVDIGYVLQQRGPPSGLEIPHRPTFPPKTIAGTDYTRAGYATGKPRRPSLQDIVLSRLQRPQRHRPQQPVSQAVQDHQHRPYYIQTPESLTLVLDGP